ncbi:hypothetical protein [Chryseobacterium camelliae]|uniref:hypothetical protein n=1 Tax=Chryseobacterium camelliae TaxID=1265445 RepID=UPI00285DC931|nr:hypothetical protein [Chryseobacterium camelliae]MDR6514261.1 hypothetical protein [Chryseobacterium camelliae]
MVTSKTLAPAEGIYQVPPEMLYQQSGTFAKLVEMTAKEGYDRINYELISSWMPKLTSCNEWLDSEGVPKIKELQSAAK